MSIGQAGDPTDPRAAFRTLRIIHVAFCTSVLIYGMLVYLMLTYEAIPRDGFVADFPSLNVLRTIVLLLALGCFGAIRFFQGRFLTPEALRRRPTSVTGSIIQWSIFTFSLAEAIAIFGLLLFLIAGLLGDFLVLSAISLLVLFWLRPKEDEYNALVRQTLHT